MEMVGRINGLMTPFLTGSMVIMMSVSGLMKSKMSIEWIYMVSAIFFLVGLLLMIPLFRTSLERKTCVEG
jgi:hypothetical protein